MIIIIAKEIIIIILFSKCMYLDGIEDETMENSRHEQVSIYLRFVGQKLVIKEHFVGFFRISSTSSKAFCMIIIKRFVLG